MSSANAHYLMAGVPQTVRYTPTQLTVLSGGSIIPRYNYKHYFADYGNGGEPGVGEGTLESPWKSISGAHAKLTADKDEVLNLLGGASPTTYAFRESAKLTWSTNLAHLVAPNIAGLVSQRVSIRPLSGATVFSPFVDVTAQGCIFAGLHLFGGFANNSAQIGWQDSGQRNVYIGCHFTGMGAQLAADHDGSRDLKLSGSGGEHLFYDCTFGLDTVDRAGGNAVLEIAGGNTRNIFRNCRFIMRADDTDPVFVLIGAGGIDRWVSFENCFFINTGTFTGGSTIAQALNVNAAAGGAVLLDPACRFAGITALETVNSGVVMVLDAQAAATSNVMVASTA